VTARAESIRGEKSCFLAAAAGRRTSCQYERCSFWEDSRAACALERLGLQRDLDGKPELVNWLLTVRSELSSKRLEFPEEPLPPYSLLPLPGFHR
jgi:hypothetical protein